MLLRVNKEGSATCKSLNKGDYILVPIVLSLIWVGSILAIQYWQRTNSTVGIHNTHSHYKLSNRIEWHKTNNTLLVDAESAHILKTKSFWYHCVALFAAGPLFSIVFHCFPLFSDHCPPYLLLIHRLDCLHFDWRNFDEFHNQDFLVHGCWNSTRVSNFQSLQLLANLTPSNSGLEIK